MGCISKSSYSPPDPILDSTGLSLTLDNQGVATLQYTLLTKDRSPITDPEVSMTFNGGTFKGFLESDTPRLLEGSDYIEHVITARGMVC
jgi:hypothetical protein